MSAPSIPLPANFVFEDGLLWPAGDNRCRRKVLGSCDGMDVAIGYCRNKEIVVQAGGNGGIWPRRLSGIFKSVYTFEPDYDNFTALAYNTAGLKNVFRFQAALGDKIDFVDLYRYPDNNGAHYVDGAGIVPVTTIDSLGLKACDLIYLDVEGYELHALKGAKFTINKFFPVIAFEHKKLMERYGVQRADVTGWLESTFGYKIVDKVRKDVVMVVK